jgi:hypothetical protein
MATPLVTQTVAAGRRLLTRAALLSDTALLVYLGLVEFVAHMLVANNYGYFRDELYYLADGRHLAFGYVDQPPLIGWLAALMNVLAGDALVAIHIIPALAGGCLVVVTGLMARALGGGRFAQFLAALASLVTIIFMATAAIFSMDVLDELWWALCAYLLIRIIKENRPRLWLAFGLVVGLLLTPARAQLRTRWPWLGGALALAFFLPYILWNAANGWPTIEFWRHYGGLSGGGPVSFLANQILLPNPLTLPLWLAGLYFYFRTEAGKPYRTLGWTYVVLYAVFTLINAKPYFLAPAYPMLFAGGAAVCAQAMAQPRRAWARPAYIVALVASELFFAPLAMPVLPPATFVADYGFLTGVGNGGAGQQTAGQFPQYLGDRFGWDTMTATVARVYWSLPAAERAQACIFTANYGEASAISLLGAKYHLPPVISGHNNYYLWGPGTCSGAVIITVGESLRDDQQSYGSVVQAAIITCMYCMAEENDLPVYVCRQLRLPLREAWPRAKHFN